MRAKQSKAIVICNRQRVLKF